MKISQLEQFRAEVLNQNRRADPDEFFTQVHSNCPIIYSIKDLDPEYFREHFLFGRNPLHIGDLLSQEIKFDVLNFFENIGNINMPVREYLELDKPILQRTNYCRFIDMKFKKYLNLLNGASALRKNLYLAQVNTEDYSIAPLIQNITNQLDYYCFGLGNCWSKVEEYLWIGPSGHTEPLHYDRTHGCLMQLHGTKTITLVPPQGTPDIYRIPAEAMTIPPWFSEASLMAPDLNKHPLLKNILPISQTLNLNAGQALYIPPGWWHEVRSIGNSYTISINRFYWE